MRRASEDDSSRLVEEQGRFIFNATSHWLSAKLQYEYSKRLRYRISARKGGGTGGTGSRTLDRAVKIGKERDVPVLRSKMSL